MKQINSIKVSLHGMNDRRKKMMASYLQNNCNGLAIVVGENDAQAEIIDVELEQSYALLEERLTRSSSKPIIALCSNDIFSEKIITVLKPVNISKLSHALKKVEKILNLDNLSLSGTQALESIETTFLTTDTQTLQSSKKELSSPDTEGTAKSVSDKIFFLSSHKKQFIKKIKVPSKKINQLGGNKFDLDRSNKRSSVRYAFQSINMTLKKNSVLGFNQNIPVLVLNNSSNGALIYLKKPRRLHGKLILEIRLSHSQVLSIPARVVRKESNCKYGVYFLKRQLELTEYLINSGHKFNFK